jgi:DnaJ-class molecular chaperone
MPALATKPSAATATPASGEGRPEMAHSTGRLFEPARSTLEDIVLGAWEDLAVRGRTECPVCHGEVLTALGCAQCGSHLS